MTTGIAVLCVVVGVIVIGSLHRFIRQGHYKRTPVKKDGEPWYETPAWLRLPLVMTYGFTATMVAMSMVLYIFDATLLSFTELKSIMPLIETGLSILLFFVESWAKSSQGLKQKYVTMTLAFMVGVIGGVILGYLVLI